MRNDLEVIVRQYPTEWRQLNVYAIGDVHVGAEEFDEKATRRKIVIDTRSATAKHAAYREIVVDANLKVGGYGLKKEYEVKPPAELQYLELKATRDPKRNVHKIINFHTIQIG